MARARATDWMPVRTPVPHSQAWQREAGDGGHLTAIVAREDGLLHLSISHRNRNLKPGRYPSWDEIADARYRFCPDEVTMVMLLPPRAEYVNVHATTFHLWEQR